ncbi:TPA: phospholipase D family protein [Pseudomonas aeruginosa]|nr:phospholipase D family protein [Pseudomonas aeruginosa]
MFLSSKNYLDQVQRLVDGAQNLDLAVAFWGRGAEKLFKGWKGDRLRVVCNLRSGGTNPYVIRLLRAMPGVQVRCLVDLHAKVVLSESAALIGSANFSTNGLGFEGEECSGWREAGIYTSDPHQREEVQAWYELVWSEAAPVLDDALQEAEENWRKRRKQRPIIGDSKRLVDQSSEAMRDRQVYLAIYWEPASEQAFQTFAEVQHDLELTSEAMRKSFDFLENWPDRGVNALPVGVDIILTYYGPNGGIKVQNAWVRDTLLDRAPIKILRKRQEVADFTFSRQDQDLLAKRLKPWLLALNDEGFFENGARCVPLYKFLAWEDHNLIGKR